jgi:oligosaccharide repeat unit polymerase
MAPDEVAFWAAVVLSSAAGIGVYRAEVRRYGGIGMAGLCAGALIVYSLINPVMYLIHPLLAFNYAVLVGPYQTAETLLPHVLGVCIFLVTLYLVTAIGRGIDRDGKRRARSVPPMPARAGRDLLMVALVLFAIGLFMYAVRNQIAYGSPFGSMTVAYAREEARPQIAFWWGYGFFLSSALVTLSSVFWWQTACGRMTRWLCVVPVGLGVMFAIVEGNRAPAAAAALFAVGWLGFARRISVRHVIGAVLLVTFFALLANARVAKTEHGLAERFADIFDPVHFRPFWSSDPAGPSVVLTLEAQRAAEGTRVSWGGEYLDNFLSAVPRFMWSARPENSVAKFAREYWGVEYSEDTGFAYSMIAEAMVNFMWFGPVILGLVWGALCAKVSGWCYRRPDGIGKLVFACCSTVLPFYLPRNYLASIVAPMMLANYALLGLIYYACARETRRLRRSQATLERTSIAFAREGASRTGLVAGGASDEGHANGIRRQAGY